MKNTGIIEDVIWVGKSLFNRGLVSGTTGNISVRLGDDVYITKSNTCVGKMNEDSFSKINEVKSITTGTPSKEYPLHMMLYKNNGSSNAIIHTHSHYITAFSCLAEIDDLIVELFSLTPYLHMKTKGLIGIVKYEQPGSQALFKEFKETLDPKINVYLLKNHGAIVCSPTIIESLGLIEELEESCRLYFTLKDYKTEKII